MADTAHHEIKAKETDMPMDQILVARKAIIEELKRRALAKEGNVIALNPSDAHRWHKPQDNYYAGQGTMNCPVCGTGKLRYSRASYNGHVHAQCTTEGCVAWME